MCALQGMQVAEALFQHAVRSGNAAPMDTVEPVPAGLPPPGLHRPQPGRQGQGQAQVRPTCSRCPSPTRSYSPWHGSGSSSWPCGADCWGAVS